MRGVDGQRLPGGVPTLQTADEIDPPHRRKPSSNKIFRNNSSVKPTYSVENENKLSD